MHDDHSGARSSDVISTRAMEVIMALLFIAVAAIVMMDSLRVGATWVDPEGPQAGYFPFRIGAIMAIASMVTLVQALTGKAPSRGFVDRPSLRQVLMVLIPAVVFVAVIEAVGIYLAAALYIAAFMNRIGKYGLGLSAAIGLGVVAVLFLMFEVWFLVPLPKGPIEEMFGY